MIKKLLILLGILGSAVMANAQVPPTLTQQGHYQTRRLSSTDPNHNNADFRAIKPGETLNLGTLKGPGEIRHIWFTIAAQDADHLRELVLKIYWDGATTPAVNCPIGDFFAQGPGKYVEFRSAAVSVGGSMALNCYWPMAYRHSAKIEVTNEGSGQVYALYYNIDYRILNRAVPDLLYFHTQYRNDFPAETGRPVTICNVNGSGQFVGTVVTVQANSDGWWGEGNDLWFIDGDKTPTIEGTGSEDYFCGAWDFGHAFQTPYFGVTYYDNPQFGGEKRGIQNTCYRWHIPNPVTFEKSLLFQLQQGSNGVNETRSPSTNNYTTVGLYYVNHPEADQADIPPLSKRIPTLVPLPK